MVRVDGNLDLSTGTVIEVTKKIMTYIQNTLYTAHGSMIKQKKFEFNKVSLPYMVVIPCQEYKRETKQAIKSVVS